MPDKWAQSNEVTEPDYKALYENLLQGVKDAKAEMEANEMYYATIHMQDDIERGMELAYETSAEILTNKTNVL
jgi:hypothetical protein